MIIKSRAIVFLIISLVANVVLATTLEEQFEGMKTCDQMGSLKDMNFDQYHQQASSAMPYIIERKLQPCELDLLASYCINDTFYGLEVDKITIPYDMSIYAIHFKQDVQTVKKELSQYMKIVDYDVQKHTLGNPTVFKDPKTGQAILMCDFSTERD